MATLLICEHDNQSLKAATYAAVTAALALGAEVDLLVAGEGCAAVATQAAQIAGVRKVYLAEAAAYAQGLAENLTPLVLDLATDYSHLLAPATTQGKNLMPRVAALLDVGQVSEIVAIESPTQFVRPVYAGNALASVESLDPVKVITVRTTAFDAAPASGGNAEVASLTQVHDAGISRFVKEERAQSDRPELTAARVVLAGGRGMGNKEHFALLEALADKLGAAIGATRAAVDAGFVANDTQIGQTGKIIAPELYIGVGISGAIQHVAGIKDSKVIVAINKDEDAPIFQVADYGLVADLNEALPELAKAL
ncbi:electron transfer flavoprotein subunit alpha/FixB family protein [Nitrincola tapanii]|uniref:Electron transfer flavoprotein subunit alpha n=1 Tax=Nitrincola tapanii TaxID=1708751 RepID=A0A5A9W3B9_9GAMM|nr:FAD-binding protein [Nitrincola tapanii]KAA0875102.1 electron transfer flavoprotein subunit alpha/FixB family protein [Nitrincola tapanii]